jgi:hypothetical protein
MNNHIVDSNKMPADGYYSALVQLDTGGEAFLPVRVRDWKVFKANGVELRADACSDFLPLAAWSYCAHWPQFAADELETLRAAVRALHAELQGGRFAAIPVGDILSGKVTL